MKSGFVAVSGKPNVGKSTLINTILGRKAVIVSDKPQTTRNRINCIYTTKDYQIIFVDTPGIHKPLHKLGEYMVKIAISALKGVDLILFLIDPVDGVRKTDERVAEIIGKSKIPVILVVNKIDKIKDKSIIESSIEKVKPYLSNLVDIIQVSALTGENISLLLDKIIELLPEGPQYYPDDMITDRPLAFMISEIIREKIFHLTKEEIPHSTAVVVEEIKERENGIIYIRATIYVERDSQKGIIIGKNGRMIKEIGTLARMDIEHIVDSKVFLDLHVKVKEKWRRNDFLILNTMGFKSEI